MDPYQVQCTCEPPPKELCDEIVKWITSRYEMYESICVELCESKSNINEKKLNELSEEITKGYNCITNLYETMNWIHQFGECYSHLPKLRKDTDVWRFRVDNFQSEWHDLNPPRPSWHDHL
jgi:hypothetical protein